MPVKLFAAILFRDRDILDTCLRRLEGLFSPLDYRSEPVPFCITEYYEPEMGSGLQRVLVSFSALIPPETLVDIKLAVDALEKELGVAGKRRVNVDPGYLDLFKVVLASFKGRGNKLYMGRGVWGDMTLYYKKSGWQIFPWSFPDFKDGCFDEALRQIRERYKSQRPK